MAMRIHLRKDGGIFWLRSYVVSRYIIQTVKLGEWVELPTSVSSYLAQLDLIVTRANGLIDSIELSSK